MWIVSEKNIEMTEGDFGISLPIVISGVTLGANDSILFALKREHSTRAVLSKEFDSISANTVNLVLTEEESDALPVGVYVYNLDWYQDGEFMCNIINGAKFKVVAKA